MFEEKNLKKRLDMGAVSVILVIVNIVQVFRFIEKCGFTQVTKG